jgi:hypothetical protein
VLVLGEDHVPLHNGWRAWLLAARTPAALMMVSARQNLSMTEPVPAQPRYDS